MTAKRWQIEIWENGKLVPKSVTAEEYRAYREAMNAKAVNTFRREAAKVKPTTKKNPDARGVTPRFDIRMRASKHGGIDRYNSRWGQAPRFDSDDPLDVAFPAGAAAARRRLKAYTDRGGKIHPIRNSPGYDPKRTTDHDRARRAIPFEINPRRAAMMDTKTMTKLSTRKTTPKKKGRARAKATVAKRQVRARSVNVKVNVATKNPKRSAAQSRASVAARAPKRRLQRPRPPLTARKVLDQLSTRKNSAGWQRLIKSRGGKIVQAVNMAGAAVPGASVAIFQDRSRLLITRNKRHTQFSLGF